MCSEVKKSAKAERMLAAMYMSLSNAHRSRAIGLETGEFSHLQRSEEYFDKAEEIGREAFNVTRFNVARYVIDAAPYQEALVKLLQQAQHCPLYADDVRRAIKIADDADMASNEIDELFQ